MNLEELQKELGRFHDRGMPVRIPWPTPPERENRTTTPMDLAFLRLQKIDSRQTLVIGNTVQEEQEGLNLAYTLRDTALRDLRSGRLGQALELKHARQAPRPAGRETRGLREFQYMLLTGEDHQDQTQHAAVLLRETAQPQDLRAALECARQLETLTQIATSAAIACIHAGLELSSPSPQTASAAPLHSGVRIHRLENPGTECLGCNRAFLTRRAALIHQGLEAGESETIGAGREYWENYQKDLERILDQIQTALHLQDPPGCRQCGTPLHCCQCGGRTG